MAISEYRPCLVNRKRALFHMWEEQSSIVDPSPMIGGHHGGVIKFTLAIVEYENGKIDEVSPPNIKFIDEKCKEYAFCECGTEVREPKRGRWVQRNDGYFECSCCGKTTAIKEYFYCPWCGAKMNEEDENDK